jgi:hypothetical protein
MPNCPICGDPFEARTAWQKYCSAQCNSIRQNTQRRRDKTRKLCRTCRTEKPVAEFQPAHPTCIECEQLHEARTKRCTICKRVKPFEGFHRRPNRKLGYDAACRECRSAAARSRNADPGRKARNRDVKLQLRFGITSEDFDEMLRRQGGLCAICRRPSESTLHVDHCHKSGDVRKLLCRDCNAMLGHARDDTSVLAAAIEYLVRHNRGEP